MHFQGPVAARRRDSPGCAPSSRTLDGRWVSWVLFGGWDDGNADPKLREVSDCFGPRAAP